MSILGNQAFTISTVNPGSFIDVGNYVTFTVDFVPTSAGTKSATVSIASADPQIPIFTFEVVGIATGAPDLAVTSSPNSNGPFLAIPDQASLTSTGNGTDFGTHTVEIFSNDPNQSPFSFDLALLGVDPARPIVVTDFQVLGENLEITFQADPNKTYRIAYSNDLQTWSRPASLSGIPGDLSPQSYLITGVASQSPRTFLRIEEN